MKRQSIILMGPAVAAVLCLQLVAAAETVKLVPVPGATKVVIEGTSSIHDWTVEGRIIGGYMEIEKEFLTDLSLKSVQSVMCKEKNPKVVVTIPARSLKSGKQKMDEIMLEAMRAKENPYIRFELKSMVVQGEVPAEGTPVKFNVTGTLAVAGEKRDIDMEVTMERLPGGRFKFSAAKKMKMTDFGITPPSPDIPGLARITTGDEVTVRFEWVVAPTGS